MLSTTGGEIITINGTNFGPSSPRSYVSSVLYGNDAVGAIYLRNCSFVKPHTKLTCLTAPGVGSQLFLQVILAGLFCALLGNLLASVVMLMHGVFIGWRVLRLRC